MRPSPIKGQMHDPDAMVHVLVVRVASMCMRALSAAWVVFRWGLPARCDAAFFGYRFSGGDLDARASSRRGVRAGTFLRSSADARYEQYLVQDIIRALEPGVQIGRLYVVPFGDCQREISVTCPSNLRADHVSPHYVFGC